MSNKRENIGIDIIEHGRIEKKSDSEYHVSSGKSPDRKHVVLWIRKEWTCSCPDYQKNKKKCKHIFAIVYYLKIDKIRTNAGKYAEDNCPICKKNDLMIKHGKRYNRSGTVQRYYCKRCKKRFSGRPAFKHMKHKIETIVTALDLYYRGLSLRQIANHLESIQKTKITHATVQNWIRKYVSLVTRYLENKTVNNSDKWHADETIIPVSGRSLRLWALLDSDTRFILAYHISRKQTKENAGALLKKGKKKTKNSPSEIVTDGLSAYPASIKTEIAQISDEPIIHLYSSLEKAYNNKMERVMGTIKSRTKPMLGLYDDHTADFFSDGFFIYYNYIRNHMALNDRTPAMAIGIMKNKMTWLDLIDLSEKNEEKQ